MHLFLTILAMTVFYGGAIFIAVKLFRELRYVVPYVLLPLLALASMAIFPAVGTIICLGIVLVSLACLLDRLAP